MSHNRFPRDNPLFKSYNRDLSSCSVALPLCTFEFLLVVMPTWGGDEQSISEYQWSDMGCLAG